MREIITQTICPMGIYRYVPVIHNRSMTKKTTPLEAAIKHVGSKAKLARALKVSPCYISKMLREKHVPVEQCRPIEKATNKLVTVEQLRPDIFKAA